MHSTGPHITLPCQIEENLMQGYCDLMVYPISPSTAFPTTYPMLDPNQDIYQETSAGQCGHY